MPATVPQTAEHEPIVFVPSPAALAAYDLSDLRLVTVHLWRDRRNRGLRVPHWQRDDRRGPGFPPRSRWRYSRRSRILLSFTKLGHRPCKPAGAFLRAVFSGAPLANGFARHGSRTYRAFDPACRRLYLLLKKIFWRSDVSPQFDLHDLAVNAIGFSATQETWKLKQKVVRCIDVLLARRIIRLPEGILYPKMLFSKQAKGRYAVRLYRGLHFLEPCSADMPSQLTDSPLYEPLHSIGFDDAVIRRILRTYQPRLIAECADMTLAAGERNGASFFKQSPQAYFIDNIREQAAGKRTPPDWWRELRKQEERKRWESRHDGQAPCRKFEEALDAYLKTEAREAFERTMDRILEDLKAGGQSEHDARQTAARFTRVHFVRRFRAEHPEWNDDQATRIGDVLPH